MLNKVVELIKNSTSFLVLAHEGPDGDALASTLALVNALKELGKQATAFNVDGVPDKFSFLPGSGQVVTHVGADQHFDVAFVLDVGELRRARLDVRPLCATLVNIDHHPFSEDFGDLYLVDTEACATAVLIYRILRAMAVPISKSVAICIYTAILSDTGSFRYSSANAEAFAVAGEMVSAGVDPWYVAGGLYESQELQRLQLLGLSLNTLQVSACGRYASMEVTQHMLDQVGVGPEYADSFVNYPRSIHGVEVALFFREINPTTYKLGMRSKGRISVGNLARELGGGGHNNAAGAELTGSLAEVKRRTFACLNLMLSEA